MSRWTVTKDVQATRHFIADHPIDWNIYAEPVTFIYNCQLHPSKKMAPFELVISNPQGPPSMLADPSARDVPAAEFRY